MASRVFRYALFSLSANPPFFFFFEDQLLIGVSGSIIIRGDDLARNYSSVFLFLSVFLRFLVWYDRIPVELNSPCAKFVQLRDIPASDIYVNRHSLGTNKLASPGRAKD